MIIPSILNIPKEKIDKKLIKKSFKKIHFDVMDGKFVKRKGGFTPTFIKKFGIKAEVHLMTKDPERQIKYYSFADLIYVHLESKKLESCIKLGKKYDVEIGVAINPKTEITGCEVKKILLMGVNPGKSGQKFISKILKKTKYLKKNEVTVDGGVNENNIKTILNSGVQHVVMASSLFKGNVEKNIKNLKKLV